MNIEESIKILDKFTTEHKLFNIKHSDGLEEAIETLLTAYEKQKDKIKAKIEEMDIEIQCCEYADDDVEEYKQDMEKEKRRLLRDKVVLQSLLEDKEEGE